MARAPDDQAPRIATIESLDTAVRFIVRSLDRLEEGVQQFEQTARENFATGGEVDRVKDVLTQTRIDVDKRFAAIEALLDKKIGETREYADKQIKDQATHYENKTRVLKWLIYGALPVAAYGVLRFLWDLFTGYLKSKVGP